MVMEEGCEVFHFKNLQSSKFPKECEPKSFSSNCSKATDNCHHRTHLQRLFQSLLCQGHTLRDTRRVLDRQTCLSCTKSALSPVTNKAQKPLTHTVSLLRNPRPDPFVLYAHPASFLRYISCSQEHLDEYSTRRSRIRTVSSETDPGPLRVA